MDTEKIKKIVKDSNLKHIAIIMDGNRRWAKSKMLPTASGHKKGVKTLKTVLKSCAKFGIKYLTVYAFSTENWKRTQKEVSFLMQLLAKTIKDEVPEFNQNDIKLKFIGERISLSKEIKDVLEFGEKETKNNKTLTLQIAFNYGAKQEITSALKNIIQDVQKGKINIDDIKEETVTKYLYTKNVPDPDLLIRTGGEKRISNYLLWQCAYSEIYVTDEFWPDFNEKSLTKAILEFNSRNRRFGK